jgi:hypothetical protein
MTKINIIDRPIEEKWNLTSIVYKKIANSVSPNTMAYTFGPNIIDLCAGGDDPLIKPSQIDMATRFYDYDYHEETEDRLEAAKETLWSVNRYCQLPLHLATRMFMTTTFMGSNESHRILNCALSKFPEIVPVTVDYRFGSDTIEKVATVCSRYSVSHFNSVWKDETLFFLETLMRSDEDWKKYKTAWKARFTHI